MKETLEGVRKMVWGDSKGANATPDISVSARSGICESWTNMSLR